MARSSYNADAAMSSPPPLPPHTAAVIKRFPIALTFSPETRFSVVAETKLVAGDLVMRCAPVETALLPQWAGQKCSGCYRSASGAMKLSCCGRCKSAWYCSKACQKGDWSARHTGFTPVIPSWRTCCGVNCSPSSLTMVVGR